MKKYIAQSILVAALAVTVFSALPSLANATAVTWNNFSNDCHNTVIVANHTTQENASATCWGTSVNAKAGDIINVGVSYHNTSSVDAPSTIAQINDPQGSANAFTFNGFIASGATQATGSAVVNFTDGAHTLTLIGANWQPNNGIAQTTLPVAYTQNLGTIPSAASCASAGQDSYCHAGLVTYVFQVSAAPAPTTSCAISVFRVNPTSVASGNTSNVIWYTTGCSSVSVSGLGVSSSAATGSLPTPALTSTTTYTITARDSAGNPQTQSQTVSVTQAPSPTLQCSISYFNAPTSAIPSGTSASLSWNTSNCTSVSISGLSISSTQYSGSTSTPALTSTTQYTLTASGANTVTAYATVTVAAQTGGNCKIDSFLANPTIVPSGNVTTLSWGTTDCTNVTMSGPLGILSYLPDGPYTTGPITQNTLYTLTASGATGAPLVQPLTVYVSGANPTPTPPAGTCAINFFTGPTTPIARNTPATLTWNTSGCTSVSISGLSVPSGELSGSMSTGLLSSSTTYTLYAYGNGTPVSLPLTVTVQNGTPIIPITPIVPPPQNNCSIGSFYASPSQVQNGQSSTLIWTTYGCTNVTISGTGLYNYNSEPLSGQMQTGAINGNNTYTLTASGTNTVSQTVTVTAEQQVYQQSTPPVVTTYAASNITETTATLNGYLQNATNYTYGQPTYYGNSTYYFEYGTSQGALYNQTPSQTMSQGSSSISAYVSGLIPNTTYYFEAVGQNSYGTNYGSVLSFVTTGNTYIPQQPNISVVTSVATNVTTSSAQLNGVISASGQYGTVEGYFEYGTSAALGLSTPLQPVSTNTAMNFFNTIATSPNTTYYYRADAVASGVTYNGSILSFSTSNNTNFVRTVFVNTNTTSNTTTSSGTGGGSPLVMLTIADQFQNISVGTTVDYTVNYKNISDEVLSNAILDIVLPTGVTFRNSTLGVLTTNNTVAVTLGTLPPGAAGTVVVEGTADGVKIGDSLIATATLSFTTPDNAQADAIAYSVNTVGTNSLAGLAFLSGDFFPQTLLGWILLLGLIFVIVLLARRLYERKAPVPMSSHTTYNGTHPDNLPH